MPTDDNARQTFELEMAHYWLGRAQTRLEQATAELDSAQHEFNKALKKAELLGSTTTAKAGNGEGA